MGEGISLKRVASSGLFLLVLFALVALWSGIASADRDYEVLSEDVNGDPTSYNHAESAWGGMQALTPYSVSFDGTRVSFAKRNGGLPHEPGYVPLAPGEWCGTNGGCRDIYVRDTDKDVTESVLSHLTVGGLHPNSYPTIGSSGGAWAGSDGAEKFAFGWYCNRDIVDHGEVIGGTEICSSPGQDLAALVWLDITTDTAEVIAMSDTGPSGGDWVDMSTDGHTVLFSGYSLTPVVDCFRANWECSPGSIFLWEKGGSGPVAIASKHGVIQDQGVDSGDFTVVDVRLSGDASKAFFIVRTRDFDDSFGRYAWHLFVYDVANGGFSEIDLPWEDYGYFQYETPQYGWTEFSIIGSTYNGDTVYVTVYNGQLVDPEYLPAAVNTSTGAFRPFEDVYCANGNSVSYDGRYVACHVNRFAIAPQAILDTKTGKRIGVTTSEERFSETNHGFTTPYVSGDGNTFAVGGHRVPEDDKSVWTLQLYYSQVVDPTGSGQGVGTFDDDDGNTFEDDIEWLAAEGITRGCNPPTNNLFCPDDYVTRGQMAAFMVRAFKYQAGAGADLFIDDDGTTFENDIDKLGTARVTRGCNPPTNNRYCPDDPVTRGQMAAFLVRALGYTDNGGGNLFIDDNGHTFENDIDRLGTAGVTRGCNPPTNNRYCPNDYVTRGQMAAFLHRALGS